MRESEMKQDIKPSQTPGKSGFTISQEGGKKNKQKNTRRDAWPDFHLMKMISIIHLTAGGLRRQSQQTVTHTVSAKQMTGRLHIIAN